MSLEAVFTMGCRLASDFGRICQIYIYIFLTLQKKLDQQKNKGQILWIMFGIDALSVYFIILVIPQRMLGNVVLSYKYITSKCG